jgi:Zn-dependent membrane protease YugP
VTDRGQRVRHGPRYEKSRLKSSGCNLKRQFFEYTYMHLLVLTLILLAVVFGPGLWVKRVMRKYSEPADRYRESGAQLARQLLDAFQLTHVKVERTEIGDHYDPKDKAVRLTPDKFDSRSLTAVTVAAHEVGHALQDHQDYAPLRIRTHLVVLTRGVEKFGAAILMASPFIGMVTRAPSAGILMFVGGLASLGTAALVHLATLPTELDASFTRAMPMLEKGEILLPGDAPHARRLLTAAAFTYVAASLMSLLNVARWWAILRR